MILTEQDQKRYNILFENLKSFKDCESFLSEPYIQSQLQLTSTNALINLLLFTNRSSDDKMLIEFIGSSKLILPTKFKMFENIIINLTHKYNIIFIESDCCNIGGNINFILKCENSNDETVNSKIKSFTILKHTLCVSETIREDNAEDENKQEEEGEDQENSEEKANKKHVKPNASKNSSTSFLESEGLAYKESKIFQKLLGKVKSMKKKSKLLSKFDYDFRCTSYVILDINDFLYSEFSSILSEIPNMLATLVDHYKHLKVVLNFPIGSNINKDNAEILSSILSFGDYIIFDKNDVIIPNQNLITDYFFNKEQEVNILKDVHSYRKKGIKNGIFIEDLTRFSYLEQEIENNHTLLNNAFIMDVYNIDKHTNTTDEKVIEERKKTLEIIAFNYDILKFSFLGAYFSKIFKMKCHDLAYTFGFEIYKKLIELFRNGFDIPAEKNYFTNKPQLLQTRKKSKTYNTFLKGKEENFLLDCPNIQLSSIKPYNPILDKHMTSFFENKTAGKLLCDINVINRSGITIKNIFNKKIVEKLPVESEIDIKKFYHCEEIKIYPEERDLPKLKLLKVSLPLNILKHSETTKNPMVVSSMNSFSKTNMNSSKVNESSHSSSLLNINPLLKHFKNASSVSNISVNTGFWENHNISIKESPYLKDSNLNSTYSNRNKLKPIDLTNYNRFLSDIENNLKSSTQFALGFNGKGKLWKDTNSKNDHGISF